MSAVNVTREIGGKTLKIETGLLAKQADGAVLVTYGETVILATVVSSDPRPGTDFFPLTVDYRERTSAAGKFPGGFIKREGRPTTKETLTARMIDRPIRPLFPFGYFDEVLVQIMVMSADGQNDPDVLSMIGASAALAISSVPFEGPIAAVRVARINGQFKVMPTTADMDMSDLDLLLSGTEETVNMIEVGARELPEATVLEAIKLGHGVIREVTGAIRELQQKVGKPKFGKLNKPTDALVAAITQKYGSEILSAKNITKKQERNDAVRAVKDKIKAEFGALDAAGKPTNDPFHIALAVSMIEEKLIREMIMSGKRPDGRDTRTIRPLMGAVALLPRTHGSALFQRGETQVLTTATLGTGEDEQIVDGLGDEYSKKFMLHYNFPPFSTGEVKRIMGPGRREIGHGALAERSLEAVLPTPDVFPYVVRLVCDVMESNGSSSMASVCSGTLALLDAGVPILRPVAGISIGLVSENGRNELLTDIIGEEDHYGDMDFKVSGTTEGITGIQLDLKIRGLTFDIIEQTFVRAKEARLFILGEMAKVITAPRPQISQYAPRLLTIRVNPEKIGKIIGPGGKMIKAIVERTGAKIDIEDDGTVFIAAMGMEAAEKAREEIERLSEEVKIGKIYNGKVTSIKDFGAFIEVIPGQDGLCHISELSDRYLKSVGEEVKLGQQVRVKVIAIDDQGRIKLSRKQAMRDENPKPAPAAAPAGDVVPTTMPPAMGQQGAGARSA
ncbi:MAG TPA: polyribonucleotide nucleotidyltransferase [Phycisphaerae bacterium]|jgi:polyribonucleotide nucleotidyltransferase|nr:polyribonucleotide nucleotidyltransferase [Phycisphaerae bacterium]